MQKYFLIVLFSILSLQLVSQNSAIGTNEKLTFTAAYNMSGILTDLAEVEMETNIVKTSKSTLLKLKFTIATYSKWDHFFKIRDLYETYVHPQTLKPYLHNRDINEGSFYKNMKYTFMNDTKVKAAQKNREGVVFDTQELTLKSTTKDIVTTLYYLRTIDFSKLGVGTNKTFSILFDKKETQATITYLGKETISTAIGKKECYKLAMGSSEKVLQGKNNNILYLTADANKILVYAKFKIPVGNGEIKIKSASGLLN